ncbi:hypothetical protein CHU98_g9614 [Xylaria longipes]|nr:hypothetical protein CHU98_g9614 [Xylaria longipes]
MMPASRQADYPLVDAISDGANDGVPPPVNPYTLTQYDATKDGKVQDPFLSPSRPVNSTPANVVPKYTREYLQKLSAALDAHLRNLDDATTYYPETLTKTRKVYKCLMVMLIVLGLLWLATAIVIIVAIFKGSGGRRGWN